jgi:uncharacterized surface protein with fasciclin (FAS1) repeats
MNTKPLFAAIALSFAVAVPGFAQDVKTKSDGDKTKSTTGGMVVKTKAEADGKMKVKGKSDNGAKMKATTKPREDGMGMSSKGVMVGGALMTPDKDIIDNAAGSKEHTTLVSAVKAANLVPTLKSAGPFTVFAPTDAAFNKLPGGTVNTLLQPDMQPTLTKVLTYHVVAGRLLASDLKDGQTLTTVEGETLQVARKGDKVMLTDAKGGTATVTIPNVISSNGVTHVIDTVLMPAK